MLVSIALGILVADLTNAHTLTAARAQTIGLAPVAAGWVPGQRITATKVLVNGVVTNGTFLGGVAIVDSLAPVASLTSGGAFPHEAVAGADRGAFPHEPQPLVENGAFPHEPVPGDDFSGGAFPHEAVSTTGAFPHLTTTELFAPVQIFGGVVRGQNVRVVNGVITGQNLVVEGTVVSGGYANVFAGFPM